MLKYFKKSLVTLAIPNVRLTAIVKIEKSPKNLPHKISDVRHNFPDDDGIVTDKMGNKFMIESYVDPLEKIKDIRYVPLKQE